MRHPGSHIRGVLHQRAECRSPNHSPAQGRTATNRLTTLKVLDRATSDTLGGRGRTGADSRETSLRAATGIRRTLLPVLLSTASANAGDVAAPNELQVAAEAPYPRNAGLRLDVARIPVGQEEQVPASHGHHHLVAAQMEADRRPSNGHGFSSQIGLHGPVVTGLAAVSDREAGVLRIAGAARKPPRGPSVGGLRREPGRVGDRPRATAPRLDGDDERERGDRRSEDLKGRVQAQRSGREPGEHGGDGEGGVGGDERRPTSRRRGAGWDLGGERAQGAEKGNPEAAPPTTKPPISAAAESSAASAISATPRASTTAPVAGRPPRFGARRRVGRRHRPQDARRAWSRSRGGWCSGTSAPRARARARTTARPSTRPRSSAEREARCGRRRGRPVARRPRRTRTARGRLRLLRPGRLRTGSCWPCTRGSVA